MGRKNKRSGSPSLGGKTNPKRHQSNRSNLTTISSRKLPQRAPHWAQLSLAERKQRVDAFELLRLRRKGFSWRDAEKDSGVTRDTAQHFFPRAFFRDSHNQLQVRAYDRYTEYFRIPTTRAGQFPIIRARGSRQRSLVGRWVNAINAAGGGDFSLIDRFPRGIFIDGLRLATSHYEVSRIAAALAESDEPFEDIYALAGAP